jgi:hypothetical protein
VRLKAASVSLAAVSAALALAGCGDDDEGSASGLTSLVPADVPLYIEAEVRPEGADREAIESLSSKLAGIDDPGGMIIEELERSAAEEGEDVTYSEDIEPWLGERAGLFIGSFEGLGVSEDPEQFGGVIETTDEDAASAFVEEAADAEDDVDEGSYEGVDYRIDAEDGTAVGVVEGQLVIADEESFRQVVDASGDESLDGNDEYASSLEAVGGADQLATLYMDFGAVLDAMAASGEIPQDELDAVEGLYGGLLEQPLAAAAQATDSSVTIDASVPSPEGFETEGSGTLADAPEDAWLAVGVADLGAYFDQSLSQLEQLGQPELSRDALESAFQTFTGLDLDEVLDWMGEAHVWMRGTSESDLQLGVSVATSDEQASGEALDAARQAISQIPQMSVGPPAGDADAGFSIDNEQGGAFTDVELADGQVTLLFAASRAAAQPPGAATLDSSQAFGDALDLLGSDYTPSAFLSFEPLVDFIRSTGEATDPETERVLGALGAVALGTRADDDRVDARLGITVP